MKLHLYQSRNVGICEQGTRPPGMPPVVDAVDFLFHRPIFSGSDFTANPAIKTRTAGRILNTLHDKGLLIELRTVSGRRPAIYGFKELLNIVEGSELF